MVHVKGLRLIFGEMRYPNLVLKNDCLKLWWDPCTSDSAVLLRKKILFQIKKRRYLPHS